MPIDPLGIQAGLNRIAEVRENLERVIEELVDVMLAEGSQTNYSKHELLMLYTNSTAVALINSVNQRVESEHLAAALFGGLQQYAYPNSGRANQESGATEEER